MDDGEINVTALKSPSEPTPSGPDDQQLLEMYRRMVL